MLLKSASTPVLGSLLASFSESPSNNHYQCEISNTTAKQTPPSIGYSNNGFRRAQSEGNLESLANASGNIDEFSFKNMPNKFARRRSSSLLETIPSFSVHNLNHQREYEESDEEEDDDFDEKDELYDSYNQFGMETMSVQENIRYGTGYGNVKYEGEREQMYLARGLGVAGISFANGDGHNGGGGDGGGYRPVAFDRDGGDNRGISVEEHYKKMLEENPSNPLFLRNYAQFLYQEKHDLRGAEEYYSRAILADPSDGEVLSHYAKLVWELHRDKDRATNYFERAVQATSEDSQVHAAYASFLWEVEDEDEDEDEETHETSGAPTLFHTGAMTTVTT